MKPRVLISDGRYRLVRIRPWENVLERYAGRDAMGRVAWAFVDTTSDDFKSLAWNILDRFADQLTRRELMARKARRRRK